ncbi:MAG: rhomboid family intramembrane serine protease [Erysipelotrichaceae bacterium]|nr:rhomboid family intramembrane serine protease [Erysipelotrichaceae bacterium]
MEVRTNIWALQLLKYFVFNQGYLRVTVAFQRTGQSEEYWLVNPKAQYQVIHISNEPDSLRALAQKRTLQAFERIMELINTGSGRLLDISLNEEATSYSSAGIDYLHLYPGAQLDEKILQLYPELPTVVFDVEDPEKELVNLEKEIVLQSMQARRNARNAVSPLRRVMCKSFLIPGVICVVIWAAVNIVSVTTGASTTSTAIALGAYYKAFLTILHQYWRLLTSGFVHVSILHLLCNLVSLFSLAHAVEEQYGFKKSMLILLLSIMMGNLLEFVTGPNKVCVGLSGGLYGYLGAMTVFYVRAGHFRNSAFRRSFFNTLYINVMISFLPNVSYISHLAGFVTGAFAAMLCDGKLGRSLKINVAVCCLLLAGTIGYLGYTYSSLDSFYYQTDVEVAKVYRNLGLKKLAEKIETETYAYYLERR